MEVLVFLVPLALMLGLIGLAGFLWSLKNGQYDDLEGAGWRAIADDEAVSENPVSTQRRGNQVIPRRRTSIGLGVQRRIHD
jgi:cbb3-type cytochrome oxidase maturation protein